MEIKENILLAPYTTFKIGGRAVYFCVVKTASDAKKALSFAKKRRLNMFILGGGSNILVSAKGFKGLVMKMENKGIKVVRKNDKSVTLKVAAGETWDKVVKFAVKKNLWGIENLSHIPGNVGAIAVQNVGAYGQEAATVIKSVSVLDCNTLQILELKNEKCYFAYRKSIFNSSSKDRYIIFYITIVLNTEAKPCLEYRDLKNRFRTHIPPIDKIRQAIIEIRDKKYPFPTEAKEGNAGSFFKNPILDEQAFQSLKALIASGFSRQTAETLEAKVFREENKIKISAAFLMEICGLKDVQEGGAKINHNQPLVIINESGRATAGDILRLAEKVIRTVYRKTGIKLSVEPELIGFSKDELSVLL